MQKEKTLLGRMFTKLTEWLRKLSFKTGLIVLFLCVPFYILSFSQMALDISYALKGTLWVIFFGLAKTFQYTGLLILGKEGVRRLKGWWKKIRSKPTSDSSVIE